MSGSTSVPFVVFHSDLHLAAMSRLHNHKIRESVDYDYAESGDARFNDARCDLWRFLRTGKAMVVVCKIDSVGVRTVLRRKVEIEQGDR